MRHLPIMDVARRLVREAACMQCSDRPAGREALGPEMARSCEGSCPLFFHLPALLRLARQVGDEPGACDAAVADHICALCRLRATLGDFCADFAARTCPLSRYSRDVVAALQRLARS